MEITALLAVVSDGAKVIGDPGHLFKKAIEIGEGWQLQALDGRLRELQA